MKNIPTIFLLICFFYFTTNLFKNPSFSMKTFIKTKSPSAKAKGLEMSGSPNKTIFELFV